MANATGRQPAAVKEAVLRTASLALAPNERPKVVRLKCYKWANEEFGILTRSDDDYTFTTLEEPQQVFQCTEAQIEYAFHSKQHDN